MLSVMLFSGFSVFSLLWEGRLVTEVVFVLFGFLGWGGRVLKFLVDKGLVGYMFGGLCVFEYSGVGV